MNEGLINRVARQLRYQLEVKDLEEGFYNPSSSLHSESPSRSASIFGTPPSLSKPEKTRDATTSAPSPNPSSRQEVISSRLDDAFRRIRFFAPPIDAAAAAAAAAEENGGYSLAQRLDQREKPLWKHVTAYDVALTQSTPLPPPPPPRTASRGSSALTASSTRKSAAVQRRSVTPAGSFSNAYRKEAKSFRSEQRRENEWKAKKERLLAEASKCIVEIEDIYLASNAASNSAQKSAKNSSQTPLMRRKGNEERGSRRRAPPSPYSPLSPTPVSMVRITDLRAPSDSADAASSVRRGWAARRHDTGAGEGRTASEEKLVLGRKKSTERRGSKIGSGNDATKGETGGKWNSNGERAKREGRGRKRGDVGGDRGRGGGGRGRGGAARWSGGDGGERGYGGVDSEMMESWLAEQERQMGEAKRTERTDEREIRESATEETTPGKYAGSRKIEEKEMQEKPTKNGGNSGVEKPATATKVGRNDDEGSDKSRRRRPKAPTNDGKNPSPSISSSSTLTSSSSSSSSSSTSTSKTTTPSKGDSRGSSKSSSAPSHGGQDEVGKRAEEVDGRSEVALSSVVIQNDISALLRQTKEHRGDVNQLDERGWTPMHVAAHNGFAQAIRILAASGGDLEAETPTGFTPLHLGAASGHVGAVEALVGEGANPLVKNFEGESAVHLAAKNGRIDVCISLCDKYGLDIREEDGRGRDAREILVQNGFEEEAKKLLIWRRGKDKPMN